MSGPWPVDTNGNDSCGERQWRGHGSCPASALLQCPHPIWLRLLSLAPLHRATPPQKHRSHNHTVENNLSGRTKKSKFVTFVKKKNYYICQKKSYSIGCQRVALAISFEWLTSRLPVYPNNTANCFGVSVESALAVKGLCQMSFI